MTKKINSIKDILHNYRNYFFDLDGVIVILYLFQWKGEEEVKGSIDCLNILRENNKNLFFITNSSVRNREEVQAKFNNFGFQAEI